ncbi:MAG: hypothetical protein Q9213_004634 [Squamulea squamosa]
MDTTHRPAKRRFQTDITSYFNIHDPSSTLAHPEKPTLLSSLPIPPTIQSSLLNVGMRIRKAVPEGYKTQCRLVDDNIPLPSSSSSRIHASTSGYAELVPYCGISKIGGYKTQQPAPENDASSGMFFEDDNLFGSMPSSQESVPEPDTVLVRGEMPLMGAKRPFEVDEDDEGELDIERAGKDITNSGNVDMAGSIALRPIAQARNRRPAATSKMKAACDGDFEEAPFLVRDWGEDMDFGE